jgi:hypothetical protein
MKCILGPTVVTNVTADESTRMYKEKLKIFVETNQAYLGIDVSRVETLGLLFLHDY